MRYNPLMKKLQHSIDFNWYSDIHPTWVDILPIKYPYRPINRVLRVFEIFFYRRAQLDYWKS